MKYVTGVNALNFNCVRNAYGNCDAALSKLEGAEVKETEGSIYGEYGVLAFDGVPGYAGTLYVANMLRALLDLLVDGDFTSAEGARDTYIRNDAQSREFMEHVAELNGLVPWGPIDAFMRKEFMMDWIRFKMEFEY